MTYNGLPNFGNTCYINATLQCIFNLPNFKITKPKSTLGQALMNLRAQYKRGTLSNIDVHFFFQICRNELQMDFSQQNDMQEFYLALMNKMIEKEGRDTAEKLESAIANEKACRGNIDQHFYAKCKVAWWKDFKNTWSPFVNVLTGQVVSQTKCPMCGYIVHNPELFINVDVDTKCKAESNPSNPSDLHDLLKQFYGIENVEGWKCDKCQVMCGAGRILKITHLPKVLVITLKRFDAHGNKKHDRVIIPHTLTIPEDAHVFDRAQRYKLYAMGCHQGNQYGGHYYAVVMTGNDDECTIINDNVITKNAAAKVAGHEPYMLFYTTINGLESCE